MEKFYTPYGIPVVIHGIEEGAATEVDAKEGWKHFAVTCGFFGTMLSEDTVATLKSRMFDTSDFFKTGPVIMVARELWETMEEDERMAIIVHEEAHIRNGDLVSSVNQSVAPNGCSVIDDLECELAADRYAAEVFGALAVRSGLIAAISGMVALVGGYRGKSTEDIQAAIDEFLASPGIAARLDALK